MTDKKNTKPSKAKNEHRSQDSGMNESMNKKRDFDSELSERVLEVEESYDADVYFYNGDIQYKYYGEMVTHIANTKQHSNRKNAILILITLGGDGETAYRIAKLFQKTYKRFIVFVPSICKSAGTLLLIGASEILMSDIISELGPLDVQIYDKKSLVLERKTGLQYRNVFASSMEEMKRVFWDTINDLFVNSKKNGIRQISTRDALNHARLTAVDFAKPILSQLNPNEIADDYRNIQIVFEYGMRLANKSKTIDKDGIMHLIWNYHSHGFPIEKDEASTIFKKNCVNNPNDELRKLVTILGKSETHPELMSINDGSPLIIPFSNIINNRGRT